MAEGLTPGTQEETKEERTGRKMAECRKKHGGTVPGEDLKKICEAEGMSEWSARKCEKKYN